MAAFLNTSSALRRLALLMCIFIAIFFVLRSNSYSYSEYLPSWRAASDPEPYDAYVDTSADNAQQKSPDFELDNEYNEAPDFKAIPVDTFAPNYDDDVVRPEDIVVKPEDVLPQVQDMPPLEDDLTGLNSFDAGIGKTIQENHQDDAAAAAIAQAGSDAQDHPTSSPRSRLDLVMQEYLSWHPPVGVEGVEHHYPPYNQYSTRDFDPNRWEGFELNNAIYINATTDKLPEDAKLPAKYSTYPDYNSAEWLETWQGDFVSCDGPSGVPYNISSNAFVKAYKAVPAGFPGPDVGSFEAVGLDADVCFDRNSRYDAYRSTGANEGIDFSKVKWGELQNACLQRNSERYKSSEAPNLRPGIAKPVAVQENELAQEPAVPQEISEDLPEEHNGLFDEPEDLVKEDEEWHEESDDVTSTFSRRQSLLSSSPLEYKSRTALLLRSWDVYDYTENDLEAVRSLIAELSLQSGGEYQVFLFVNIKSTTAHIFEDEEKYAEKLAQYVPEEFRDIAILWSEDVCKAWYPNVGEWEVYFQQWMPVQWFAQTHPEFDYVWNWEMDARYIGNHYHFMEQISSFARQQPRKYLWERNSRYYFPAAHGNYLDFVEETQNIVASSPYVETVWGAQPFSEEQKLLGPSPPTTEEQDEFTWGVGEDADFITLLPIWDPRETLWSYRDKLWGYPQGNDTTGERPYGHIPRRAFINTLVRMSSKLLRAMHQENELGVSMASEMFPASIALQHGLKAVYVPHPIWLAQQWPASYLDAVFNADGWGAGSLNETGDIDTGRGAAYSAEREKLGLPQNGSGPNGEGKAGRWGQERDSPYNPDREHNFGGWSWYFWTIFPKTLYSRWLGWSSKLELIPLEMQESEDLIDADWAKYEQEHGSLCLPGMLLHPVKRVQPQTSSSSTSTPTSTSASTSPTATPHTGGEYADTPSTPSTDQPSDPSPDALPLDASRPFGSPLDTSSSSSFPPTQPHQPNHNDDFFDDGSFLPPKPLDAVLPGDKAWPGSAALPPVPEDNGYFSSTPATSGHGSGSGKAHGVDGFTYDSDDPHGNIPVFDEEEVDSAEDGTTTPDVKDEDNAIGNTASTSTSSSSSSFFDPNIDAPKTKPGHVSNEAYSDAFTDGAAAADAADGTWWV